MIWLVPTTKQNISGYDIVRGGQEVFFVFLIRDENKSPCQRNRDLTIRIVRTRNYF